MHLQIAEHEPVEALGLLARDAVDLALIYDYTLAPAALDRTVEATPLWSAPWGLGGPGGRARRRRQRRRRRSPGSATPTGS